MLLMLGIVAVCAFPAASVAGPNGSDQGTMCVFTTQLSPQNEIRATNTSIASGHAQIKVRNDGTIEFKYHINNPAGEEFRAGHIHLAPAGVNGPVIQSIFVGGFTSASEINEQGEVSNATLGQNICNNPEQYYVNFHTATEPAGAIRGQLG